MKHHAQEARLALGWDAVKRWSWPVYLTGLPRGELEEAESAHVAQRIQACRSCRHRHASETAGVPA